MGKRVMILSASTGSGHIKAAEAIEEACRKDARVGEVCHLDALEYTNDIFQGIYSKGYLEAVKNVPDLWAMAFDNMDKPWDKNVIISALNRVNSQPLVRKLVEYRPDICICTNFMPADIVAQLIKQDRLHCNLGIVVTDFYVHALWLEELFTRYFVAKDENKRYLTLLGLPSDRIEVTGIPVLERFSSPLDEAEAAARLGLDRAKPIVVLSAGAAGLLPAKTIGKILDQIREPATTVVVCGRNERLKAELEELLAAASPERRAAVSVVGYTDRMHEYLRLADVFVGKPGGLSTSECLASGVPMVMWDPIPGQEQYNAYHVLESGAGVLPDNIATIGYKVDQLLADKDRLVRMKASARAAGRPGAAGDIVAAMLEHPDETPVRPFKRTP